VIKSPVILTIGTKDASSNVKRIYVAQWIRLINTGVIITIQKFHIQWLLTEMATPRVLASSGRISGPQTHGTTLTVPPKTSM
jgi:hypothetical protein